MGFTFSIKMVGAKILVPGSWYQDLGTKILVPRSWHGQAWHGTEIFGTARNHKGTARKYLARHGSTRSGHGMAPDIPVY